VKYGRGGFRFRFAPFSAVGFTLVYPFASFANFFLVCILSSFLVLFGLGRWLSGRDCATDVQTRVAPAFDPKFTGVIVMWFASSDVSRIAFVENKEAAVRFHDLALRGETVEVPRLMRDAPYPEVLIYRVADGGNLDGSRAVF
jgi:hypothetical protein